MARVGGWTTAGLAWANDNARDGIMDFTYATFGSGYRSGTAAATSLGQEQTGLLPFVGEPVTSYDDDGLANATVVTPEDTVAGTYPLREIGLWYDPDWSDGDTSKSSKAQLVVYITDDTAHWATKDQHYHPAGCGHTYTICICYKHGQRSLPQ